MFDMTCLRLGCIRLTGGMPTLSLALLRWVGRWQEEGPTSTRDQIAKANSWNATASRRLVGSSTASS